MTPRVRIHSGRRPSVVSCAACGTPAEDPAARNGKRAWLCGPCADRREADRRTGYLPKLLRSTVLALARLAEPDEAERVLRRTTDDDRQLAVAYEAYELQRNLHREGRSR